mmetsp:Transcript_20947/g.30994  ORF Transcript_20947/g.30994 Transcript_20947/m.30994 type:complete len:106 (-) Transcript_20947:601-918(-)
MWSNRNRFLSTTAKHQEVVRTRNLLCKMSTCANYMTLHDPQLFLPTVAAWGSVFCFLSGSSSTSLFDGGMFSTGAGKENSGIVIASCSSYKGISGISISGIVKAC